MASGFMQLWKGKIGAAALYLRDKVATERGLWFDAGGTYVRQAAVWTCTGSPVDGTSGTLANYASPGDLLVQTDSPGLFQNANTLSSPTWTAAPMSGVAGLSSGTIAGVTVDSSVIGGTTPAAATVTDLTVTGKTYPSQGAPTAKTVSSTMTAAQVLTGIITVNQGAGASSAQQLPLATAMDTALSASVAGTAFDFSVINISTTAAESASVTTNTGWTLVGDMDVAANSDATTKSSGRFRARKTGTGAWVLYRLS